MTARVFRRSASPNPPVAVEAHGSTIVDADGREYLDAAGGAIVVNVGHGRREIAAAIAEQAGPARVRARIGVHHRAARAVRGGARAAPAGHGPGDLPRLRRLRGDRDRAQARARHAARTGRGEPPHRLRPLGELPREHARRAGPVRAQAAPPPVRGLARPVPARERGVPVPGRGARLAGARHRPQALADELDRAFSAAEPGTVCAFVGEPIVGATLGAVAPPDGYWAAIADVCRHHGVLLIADEVMTGFGRTGHVVRDGPLRGAPGHPRRREGRDVRVLAVRVRGRVGRGLRRGDVGRRLRPRVHVLAPAGRRGGRPRGAPDPGGRVARRGVRAEGRAAQGRCSRIGSASTRSSGTSAAAA